MPRYKDAEREQIKKEARRRLVDAALNEFAAEGYAGANINRISQAAGFAQGTIYNYFATKLALFEAVVHQIAVQHQELIVHGAAGATEPAARLERFFAAGCAFAQGFPEATRVIISALYGADPEVRALVYQAYEWLVSYVEHEIVRAGLLERHFRPVDPRLATALIVTAYLGGCSQGAEGDQIRQNPRAVAALLLDGLRRGAD
jgi:AcrR family transcriptional regulator